MLPIIIRLSDTLEHVIFQFVATKVHRMYVTDANNRPIGEVNLGDVLRVIVENLRPSEAISTSTTSILEVKESDVAEAVKENEKGKERRVQIQIEVEEPEKEKLKDVEERLTKEAKSEAEGKESISPKEGGQLKEESTPDEERKEQEKEKEAKKAVDEKDKGVEEKGEGKEEETKKKEEASKGEVTDVSQKVDKGAEKVMEEPAMTSEGKAEQIASDKPWWLLLSDCHVPH